ncbi:MAG: DUF3592 domain-containing protein [Clostridia bacterium]|nr:DUF3592 domain-containing protein [Clostridia bacterium]
MNTENKFARIMRNSGPARFFIPLGIVLIVVGVLLMVFKSDNYVSTTGRITSVTEGMYDDENNTQTYDLGIAYTVDGKEYNSTFSNMNGSFSVGDEIKVFYDPESPDKVSNGKLPAIIGPIAIALGVLAGVCGVAMTVKAFKKSSELDRTLGKPMSSADFDGFKSRPGVKEVYFRYDGNTFKPGYLIEDADRNPLYEGKMLKNAMVGARTFEFTDHRTGSSQEHDVGHVGTQSFNGEAFSAKSSFKFDGENVWDAIHGRGIRIGTDIRSKFPYFIYNISKNGAPYARVESTGQYVHEDEAAQHSVVIPTGHMFYRIWTAENDLADIFLTTFAISECEQTFVE